MVEYDEEKMIIHQFLRFGETKIMAQVCLCFICSMLGILYVLIVFRLFPVYDIIFIIYFIIVINQFKLVL